MKRQHMSAIKKLPMLEDYIRRNTAIRREQGAPRLRFSSAGEDCLRKIYFDAIGAESTPLSEDSETRMLIGTIYDHFVLFDIERAVKEKYETHKTNFEMVTQQKTEINCCDTTIKGTCDALFLDSNGVAFHVADLKTVWDKTWKDTKNRPKKEHISQVNLYAASFDCKTFSICYAHIKMSEDKSGGLYPSGIEYRTFFFNVDYFLAWEDFGKFVEVQKYINRGEPPPLMYYDDEDWITGEIYKKAKDRFPCGWCKYRDTQCYKKKEKGDE